MPRAALALLLAALLAFPAWAQGVRVTLTDGTTVSGELAGFENGRYRVRQSNGVLREIDERQVRDVTLTDRGPVSRGREAAGSAADDAREAFDRGDYEGALVRMAAALQDLDRQKAELGLLAGRAAQAILDGLLEKRDAARLGETLRRLSAALPPDSFRDVLSRMADRFADHLRAAPADPFNLAFADTLAQLADERTVSEPMRNSLADLFVQLARSSAEKKNFASAASLYKGAVKVDPRRAEALKAPLGDALFAHAKALFESGDARAAARAAREASSAAPGNAEARRLAEDADFTFVRQEADASYGAEAAATIREYLARNPRPEHRAWAEQALKTAEAQPDPRSATVAAQMQRYFPLKTGRFLVYRRGEGDITERVKTEAITREGDVLRITTSLQEKYNQYSTSKVYPIEIEKDSVVKPTGGEREVLLRFPLREGESWTWRSRGRLFRRSIRSLSESVTVGRDDQRRTFADCLVVDFTSAAEGVEGGTASITSRSTYAPGVGLVKLEFQEPEHKKFNLELIDYGTE